MDKLKKFLELAKLNYEKVILVLVVLALGAAVVILYVLSAEEQRNAEAITGNYARRQTKSPPALNLAPYKDALETAKHPAPVSFGLPHKLFNPVKWIKGSDGRLIVDRSGKSVGPEALRVDGIKALNMVVRFANATADGYSIEILDEAADRAEFRKPRSFTMKKDENEKIRLPGGTPKNPNQLWLREVKGPVENPESLAFEITETKERFTVTREKAFVRAQSYVADLSYPPENRPFKSLRRDANLSFGGEDYKIVEITENEVVISNRLNEKKTRLKRTP